MTDKDLSKPVGWTDEEELRDVRRVGFGAMFSVDPITPDADMRRVIPLYSPEYVQSLRARIQELEGDKDNMMQCITGGLAGSARDVAFERIRQVEKEGWKPAHDDEHAKGELSCAAISYLMAVVNPNESHTFWPFDVKLWKPSSDFRRNLVRAGALILAEIDRIDRCNKIAESGDSDD